MDSDQGRAPQRRDEELGLDRDTVQNRSLIAMGEVILLPGKRSY